MTASTLPEAPKTSAALQRTEGNGVSPALAATADSATDLLRIAVEKGASVEQLEKLVSLHERMEARQAAREFSKAMAAFQAECPSIKRNKEGKVVTSKGGTYSFTYADLDETVETVRPILAKYGLSFGWDHVVTKDTLTSTFTVRHEAGHSASNSYTLPVDNPSGMSPQQKVGAAQTFADRRSMNSGLGLTSSDEDAESGEGGNSDPTKITEDQAVILADLIKETGTNEARLFKLMGVESLEAIRATQYEQAVNILRQKQGATKQ